MGDQSYDTRTKKTTNAKEKNKDNSEIYVWIIGIAIFLGWAAYDELFPDPPKAPEVASEEYISSRPEMIVATANSQPVSLQLFGLLANDQIDTLLINDKTGGIFISEFPKGIRFPKHESFDEEKIAAIFDPKIHTSFAWNENLNGVSAFDNPRKIVFDNATQNPVTLEIVTIGAEERTENLRLPEMSHGVAYLAVEKLHAITIREQLSEQIITIGPLNLTTMRYDKFFTDEFIYFYVYNHKSQNSYTTRLKSFSKK